MTELQRYKALALVVLAGLFAGACSCGLWPVPTPVPTPTSTPFPTPTMPPYTPLPRGAVSPVVIQRSPERGEELSLDGSIELVFDRTMDQASVETAFNVSPEVAGELEWTDERTVRFKPARGLKRDAEYYVTVGAEAKASDGNPLDGAYRFRFRTVGYLEVAQVIPAPDVEDVEAASTVTVIFNRPVVPLMAVSDPAYTDLPQPVTFEPSIEGSGEWLNTSIYVFTPAEPLAGGTTYTARIAAGLADTTGGVVAEDYEWSFSTQPPHVVWVSPHEGAELIGVETTVQVTFNMPVDCDSATEAFSMRTGVRSVAGTFVSRSSTSSTPMNSPGPRTSPIKACSSCMCRKRALAASPKRLERPGRSRRSITSMLASAAAKETGLEPKVLCSSTAVNPFRSSRASRAPMGNPPPKALDSTSMSGTTP